MKFNRELNKADLSLLRSPTPRDNFIAKEDERAVREATAHALGRYPDRKARIVLSAGYCANGATDSMATYFERLDKQGARV